MKHIWRVEGMYFDWELVVRVRPAKRPPMPITESDQGAAIGRLKRGFGHHFHDLVSLHEYSLEFGTRSRADIRELTVTNGVPAE